MQASGEAVYVADVGVSTRELFAAPVESARALAKLGKVDPAAALQLPGVVAFIGRLASSCYLLPHGQHGAASTMADFEHTRYPCLA